MSWKGSIEALILSASQSWISKTPTSHLELTSSLRTSDLLKTPQIISAFSKLDRKAFTLSTAPYENKPLQIFSNEVMTSPSTHALTLELLYPFLIHSSTILDLGCGTGYLSQCFAELSPGSKIIGVDFHRENVKNAASINAYPNIEFRHCDAFEILEDSFDMINVGFTATQDLFMNLCEKGKNGVLLCPVSREGKNEWVLVNKGLENSLGEVAFSEMRVSEDLKGNLEALEQRIKELYEVTEMKLGRKPSVKDFPSEIHELLKTRRKVQNKLKRKDQLNEKKE